MSGYLLVAAIALLPVAGNLAGSLLAETVRLPQWAIGAALHAAAGVAVAVVSVDLMPRIVASTPPWLMAAAFLAGAGFSVLLARAAKLIRRRSGHGSAGGWMVYTAVAADLFSDGLMTGIGSAVATSLGLLLGLSQTVANLPGGFAAAANFRDEGMPRRARLLVAASFVLPVVLAASLGYWLLRDTGAAVQNAALAFVAGVLLLATVEDVVRQGDEREPKRWMSTAGFALGFALFALVSAYLG